MVKQLSNYAATHIDSGGSPLPPMLLVLLTELTKLLLVLSWAVVSDCGEPKANLRGEWLS